MSAARGTDTSVGNLANTFHTGQWKASRVILSTSVVEVAPILALPASLTVRLALQSPRCPWMPPSGDAQVPHGQS